LEQAATFEMYFIYTKTEFNYFVLSILQT